MNLTTQQIKDIIPHRDPFLLVDEIQDMEPGKKAVGFKKINDDAFWVPGHFPGQPIMPGVLTLEAMAQTGAVAVLAMPEFAGKLAVFGGANKVKFKKQVVPGDTIRMDVEIVKMRSNAGVGVGKSYVDGKLACSAEFTFFIVNREG